MAAIFIAIIMIAGIALYYIQNNQQKGVIVPKNIVSKENPYSGIQKQMTKDVQEVNGRPSVLPRMSDISPSLILEGLIIFGIIGVGWCGYEATKKQKKQEAGT